MAAAFSYSCNYELKPLQCILQPSRDPLLMKGIIKKIGWLVSLRKLRTYTGPSSLLAVTC